MLVEAHRAQVGPKSHVRLAILATHPIQYQVPLWRLLAQYNGLDVHVYYGSDFSTRLHTDAAFSATFKWDIPLTSGYRHTFLTTDPRINGTDGFWTVRAPGLGGHLRAFRPDACLLTAYSPFFWWEAIAVAGWLGIPTVFRAEATDSALPRGAIKAGFRKVCLTWLYNRFSRCLAIGVNARKHYLRHGVPMVRIGWSPYCIDTALFERQVAQFQPQRSRTRAEFGFSDGQTVFLFSGKLVPKKDPMTIVAAIAGMSEEQRRAIALLVVGDGHLRSEMEGAMAAIPGLKYHFAGFVNQSKMGRYYAAADILVLPSAWGETWGLVVNEAMQFGLPAVVSDRVGCAPDLIQPESTGLVFKCANADDLRRCMLTMQRKMVCDWREIQSACRRKISEYSSTLAASGIRDAVLDLLLNQLVES